MMGLKDLRAQKFEHNALFPLQIAQLIHIGEVTGNLSKMLVKIRDNTHKSVDYTLKNLSTMIEPLMIFLVALIVGSILLAVMLPFFYIGSTIH
jgi:type IV pilus assembly protein PilC